MPICDECGRDFDTDRGLSTHQRQAHPDQDPDADDTDTDATDTTDKTYERRQRLGPLTLRLRFSHALVLTFAIGLLAGGFFISTLYGVTGAVAAIPGQDDTPQAPSGNEGEQNDGKSNRVQLSADVLADQPSLGSSDAPVTVIEVSDFGCPWCAEWAGVDVTARSPVDKENVLQKIQSEYISDGEARFIYMDYPVQQLHPNAPMAHVAANCVLEQDESLYWEFHDALFERRSEWTRNGQNNPSATFQSIAQNIGVDMDRMGQCITSSDGSEYQEDRQAINSATGGVGTPTFLVGNTEDGFVVVSGARGFSTLKSLIDAELSG